MKLDFERVVRDCPANDAATDSCSMIYDFDVIVDGERRATWRRVTIGGKGYELVDSIIDEYILVRAPREDDYRPDHTLRARAEKKADFAAITDGLLASGRIPSIADYKARLEGWGRAILERRENERTKRLHQAQREFATRLYDALDALLSDRTTHAKVRALLGEVDIRAKEFIDHDAECYARDYGYEVAPIEAFTTTLSRRVQS